MASAGARAYNGGLGAEPPAEVQGAEPLVEGQGGEGPPEADSFFENIRLEEWPNWLHRPQCDDSQLDLFQANQITPL